MKKNLILLLFAIANFIPLMNAQSPQWVLGTSLVNFQNTLVPQLLSNPLGQAWSGIGSNAGFGPDGELLFYIRGNSVYNRNNVNVGYIDINNLGREVSVVNVPGTCNEFYIIAMTQRPVCINCSNELIYVKVTVNGLSVSLSQTEHIGPKGDKAFAISKLRKNKTRYLFVVGNNVDKFLIDRNGISHHGLLPAFGTDDPTDVELFEDPVTGNMRLAFGEGTSNLIVHNLDSEGNYINTTYPIIPAPGKVHGVEFVDYNNIIIAQNSYNPAYKGILIINLLFQYAHYIPNSAAYHNSYIERAADWKFYVSKENGSQGYKLASINPNAITVTEVPNLTLPNMDIAYYGTRLLPDQIDYENYNQVNYRWDLAAFDNAADTGAEPYIPSPGNEVIWESNDIWNRKTVNGLSVTHQNPGYSSDPSRYNIMRFRVRNIGCTESTESRVRLYWTMGATGESWDNNIVPVNPPSPTALNSWDGSKCIINPQTSTCIPAGGELKSKSLVFNSNAPDYDSSNPSTPGFIVPPLQPGQEIIIDAKWQPVNPSLFGDPNVISNPILCFLGRIVNVNDPMYSELPASTTNMMGDNVKNNNNIVTRNTSLVPLGVSEGTHYQYDSSIFIGNPTSTQTDFIVRFDRTMVNDNSFSNIGRIKIKLDDRLWEKWTAAGSEGKGIEIFNAEKHEIEVTNFDNAQLANISLEPGEYRAIKFTFELKQPTDLIQDYQYTVSQVSAEKPDQHYGSACVFNVKINHTQETGESFYEEMAKTSPSNTHSNFKGISIAPNPSSDFAKLDFELSQNNLINIQVFDLLGKMVKSIESNKNFNKGLNNVNFSTSDLPSGSYFVIITAPEERISVQLVIKH
ncbi:T9SS type A sorting domain-containing protein [Chryseobacterium sp. L7]|uniref:T9SS type A sorting domain-containing protein n=1 Tax=Chryseobacterium endalhagicum TaxID=2797638 RepID=A0ABS1QES6_9FLAO|nr:T9SS type A sorting domain-containing protein [Chryseobacterium endalhagicum]MBL1220408.1 T9SS type A sorting domain-containing protein [Chryseobacterium endalhagicum]